MSQNSEVEDFYSWQLKSLPMTHISTPKEVKDGMVLVKGRSAFDEDLPGICIHLCPDYPMVYEVRLSDILLRYHTNPCANCKKDVKPREILEHIVDLTGKSLMCTSKKIFFYKNKNFYTNFICALYLSSSICPDCVPLNRKYLLTYRNNLRTIIMLVWESNKLHTQCILCMLPKELVQYICRLYFS